MKKLFAYILVNTMLFGVLSAQIAVNTDGSQPDESAILDVKSTSKGILIPRLTTAQRTAINSPAQGLMVYDTDENNFFYFDGSSWKKIGPYYWDKTNDVVFPANTNSSVKIGSADLDGDFSVGTRTSSGTYGSNQCTNGYPWASNYLYPHSADKAFDQDISTYFMNNNILPVMLQYDFDNDKKRISKYRIYFQGTSYDYAPMDWDFEASNDGNSWSLLDKRRVIIWNADQWKEFTFSNSTLYQYYRLKIYNNKSSVSGDNYLQVYEVEMMEKDLTVYPSLVVKDDKVGILTETPSASLDIEGSFKYIDGNESSGKVLASGTDGEASWTDGALLNGGGWYVNSNNVYNTGKQIGIGTSTPEAGLEINGDMVLGSASNTPQTGMIRWNATLQDFECYNGTNWLSMTDINGGWGNTDVHENQNVYPDNPATHDNFGNSVAVSGDYAVIGAYRKDVGSYTEAGKAYIFNYVGGEWTQQAELAASDGYSGDNFGVSVSVSGNYAIVGADKKNISSNDQQGKAYIFHFDGNNWTEQQILTASDGAAYDYFGHSVSISGNYAVVGAYGKDVSGNTSQGSVYVFHYDGNSWTEQQIINPSDGTSNDNFGFSVNLSGNYFIAGSYLKTVNGNHYQGKVYIYYNNGNQWTEQAALTAADGTANDKFGYSVGISDSYAIVGAYKKDVGSYSEQGKVYIYQNDGNGWSLNAEITEPDGGANDNFGCSVSISNNFALIGAQNYNVAGNSQQGKAFIYFRNGNVWSNQAKLVSSDGSQANLFGQSVAVSDNYALVGVPLKNNGHNSGGKTYFFMRF